MTPLGRRQKCLRIRSEKRQFGYLMSARGRTGPLWRGGKASALNPASNVAFAHPRCRCDCESELKIGIPVNLEAMLRMISSFSVPRALYAVKRRVAGGLLHAPCRNGWKN